MRYFFTHLDSEFDENDSPTFANGVSRFLDFGSSPPSKRSEVEGVMNSFAEFLFDNFYLPCIYSLSFMTISGLFYF